MKQTLIATDNALAPFAFEFKGMEITNPTMSECGRFPVSPEYYGFEIINTGGGCTAHAKQFTLDGQTVLMLLTDDLHSVFEDTKESTVGLYDEQLEWLEIPVWTVTR